jgi:hypothetical protein
MDKKLVSFNIKNAAYAIKNSDGTYDPPVKFGYSDSFAMEANYSEKQIFGDGMVVLTIPNDKGKTGTLTLLNVDEAYEIAMGRRMAIAGGTAEIKQYGAVEHAVYLEFEYVDETTEATKTSKVWVYGVTSSRPSETLNQNTDDINNNNVDIPVTIKGVPLYDAEGTGEYTDGNGNVVYVWCVQSSPSDAGYATFGAACVVPKVTAA